LKNKISVSAVSYLNTKPFLYGLYASGMGEDINLSLDIPSSCAQKLASGSVELGLVPVAAIPTIRQATIISDYCIGTLSAVKTVGIYAPCPIQEVTHLYLDYQSRTSVALTKYLLQHHWNINPVLIEAKQGYEQSIKGKKAALIIGDRTIGIEDDYPFFYDLGEEWYYHTGKPFVFAAWVSNRPLSNDFVQRFNKALAYGIEQRDRVATLFESCYPNFDVHAYYNDYINYSLDTSKKEALRFFLDKVAPQQASSWAG
jgi:chorismate dehydratase